MTITILKGVLVSFWEGFLEENFDTGEYDDMQRLQTTEYRDDSGYCLHIADRGDRGADREDSW